MSNCPSCDSEVPTGSRWCPICHHSIIVEDLGSLASPGRRLGAYFMDLIVAYFACFIIFTLAVLSGTNEGYGIGIFIALILDIAYLILVIVLFSKGTTPGKRILGMRVVKEDGRKAGFFTMLIREVIGKFISGIVLFIGYIWILFDKENQGWHDKLMSTYVIKK